VRDAVLFSGWRWESFNAPERIAIAFARAGARVLYCENPVSRFLRAGRKMIEVFPGVHAYGPEFLGHRLNVIPGMRHIQCCMIASEMAAFSESLRLRRPVFVYPHARGFTPLCRKMKSLGFPLVHICMDYPEPFQEEQIALADRCLVIPPGVVPELQKRYGEKIVPIPQLYYSEDGPPTARGKAIVQEMTERIPRPWLAYVGAASDRLDLPLIEGLLRARPGWQLIVFGGERPLTLPNVHVMPWISWRDVPTIVESSDIGFMPYERVTQKNRECVPLKLFDYFAVGLPVVATPISYLQDMDRLVYIGDSVASLSTAVERALAEPPGSPVKEKRKEIAYAHSVETRAPEISRAAGLESDARTS
jgi:glycosyltransferase involved in cell wall biosynthesis